jgi:hypothetical protein
LRWDYEETPAYLDYVTPANVVAGLNSVPAMGTQTYAQSLAQGGIDVNDYISTGGNRDADTDNWQPRLGFSYDIGGDQAHVVFGGAGRSYDRNLYQWTSLEVSKGTLPAFNINFNGPLHPCTPSPTCVAWDPAFLDFANLQALVAASNAGGEVFLINNDLEVPYADQFSLGMRNRLGESDWMTSATVTRVLTYEGFVYTLGNRRADGTFWLNGGQPFGDPPPGFGNLIVGNNGIETRTTQVLLSVEKPFSGGSPWATSFAYTYTDAEGNRDVNETFAFDAETIEDYPFIASNATPEHRLVATASYAGPWGFLFAGKLTLATPLAINGNSCFQPPGVFHPSGADCVPVAEEPDDTLGYRSLDLQVTKDFEIADVTNLYVRVDVLNVFDNENYNDTVRALDLNANGEYINPTQVRYNETGNIVGVSRTLRLTLGARF